MRCLARLLAGQHGERKNGCTRNLFLKQAFARQHKSGNE
jgi:hypothetical protein